MTLLTHRRSLWPLLAAMGLGAGMFGFVGPSVADVSAVSGGAFGESVDVSFFGGEPVTSGPLPSVTLSPDGGAMMETASSVTVGQPNRYAPFGGRLLETGTLKANSQGTTGSSGSSTTFASAAGVDVLGGILTTPKVTSTCTSSETGPGGSTTFTGGSLVVSETDVVTLPLEPAPNTTIEGGNAGTGDTWTVILNEQVVDGASITVNGVHLHLTGPWASGEIILAQSRCGTTALPPATTTTTTTTTTTPTPTTTTTTTPTPEPAPAPSHSDATGSSPAAAEGSGARTEQASPEVAMPVTAGSAGAPGEAQAAAGAMVPQHALAAAAQEVSKVSGGACSYYVDVGLFGGPKQRRGCGQAADAPVTAASPSVTLPASGSATPIVARDPDGAKAQYGPAVIFGGIWPDSAPSPPPSGPLSATTVGTTGRDGAVTSSTSVVLYDQPPAAAPGGAGPGPLIADEIRSTCTADASGVRGSAAFVRGILETKYDQGTQEPVEREPIPASPAVNYTRTGTIDHVGDSFKIVFNEQVREADGTLTVNAAHMYLLGPIAKGDMVVGQSRCGVTLSAAGAQTTGATTTTTTTSGGSPGSASPSSSTAGGAGATAAAGGGAATGEGATVAGAGTARSATGGRSGSAGGAGGLARTGMAAPLLPGLLLLSTGLLARCWVRRYPPDVAAPNGCGRH